METHSRRDSSFVRCRRHIYSKLPSRYGLDWRLIGSFTAVYLIWGSTFLAIRYAISTIPPFLMAGFRYLIAGTVLYGYASAVSAAKPEGRHWKTALILGALLFLGGNGAVVWSEQRVPSGLTALMIGTEPLWMALLDWWRPGGRRPDLQIALGLAAGFGATVLLVAPGKSSGGVDPIGAIVLVFGTLCWAVGSLYSRHADSPRSQLLTAGMQLLAGGVLLLVLALLSGEARGFSPSAISLRSLFCFSYLVIFGAVVAFTCYNYMLKSTSTAMSSTYAFVNPAVAVVLGALIGGERITSWTIVAASAIVLAVVLITTHKAPVRVRNRAVSEGEAEPEPAQSTTPTEYEVP